MLFRSWYAWTAPSSGRYLVWTEGEERLPDLIVMRGAVPDQLSLIGVGVSGATNGQVFTALAGEKLLVRVSSYDSSPRFTLHLRAQPALVNDEFDSALELPAAGRVEGNTIGATWNYGEPGRSYYDQFAWWKWTAPSSGVFHARFQLTPRARTTSATPGQLRPNSSVYGAVQVFTGDVGTGLTQVADLYGEGGAAFRAVAGVTYVVAVRGGFAHFTLGVEAVTPPANDNFADAEILTGTNLAVTARLLHVTREPGEPGSGSLLPFGFDGGSVWYRWTAPEEGAYAFEVSPPARLILYTGEELVSLQPLTHSFTSRHTIRVAAGETLWMAVTEPPYSISSTVTLRLQKVTPPANDDFAQREILTGVPVSFVPRTRHATLETNEPYATPSLRRTPATVWYEWAAPSDGEFTLASQSGGSGYSTLWRIQGGFPEQAEPSRFTATAGEIFHLVFSDYGYGYAEEPFVLQPASGPVNDRFAQRLVLTGADVTVNGTTVGATREEQEPESAGENTVWYSWTAPRTGQLLVELGDDNHSPGLRAFTGEELAALEPRPENEIFSSSGERYNLAVQAGVTYQLAITSNESFTSEGAFRLTLRFAERPANDDFAPGGQIAVLIQISEFIVIGGAAFEIGRAHV